MLLLNACECPTSGDIANTTTTLDATEFLLVDAIGANGKLQFEIAEIAQVEIPENSLLPFVGSIESGRQILSIFTKSSFYFSGPIDTELNKQHIGVLEGSPLFASFNVFRRDTLPLLAVYNASGGTVDIGGENLASSTLLELDTMPAEINATQFESALSVGMLVITSTDPTLQYVEIP